MNDDLRRLLEADYAVDAEWQPRNQAEAEEARRAGDMPGFFDRAVHIRLPNTCWALERWDEARRWYRHNTAVFAERRAWHEERGDTAPLETLLDWEAATTVKAGHLQRGRELLRSALAVYEGEPGSDLIRCELGLHAAQVGLSELAAHASAVVAARQELPGADGADAERARELLHYEPAQVALLLGRWSDLRDELDRLEEAERLVEGRPELAFPAAMQAGIISAARGLRELAALREGDDSPEARRDAAVAAFEEAMVEFYRFGGRIDGNTYFLRLDARLAADVASGREPVVNPFADGGKA